MKTITISIPTTRADLGSVVATIREYIACPFAIVGIGLAVFATEIAGGDLKQRMRDVLSDNQGVVS